MEIFGLYKNTNWINKYRIENLKSKFDKYCIYYIMLNTNLHLIVINTFYSNYHIYSNYHLTLFFIVDIINMFTAQSFLK